MDHDPERTIIEDYEPRGTPPPPPPRGYPPSPPEPERRSGLPIWAYIVIGAIVLVCLVAVGIGAMVGASSFIGVQATAAMPATATLPAQQNSPAASVTPAVVEGSVTPTIEATDEASTTPTSAVEAVEIQPYCDYSGQSPVTIRSDQPVRLVWTWTATTAELVQDHIDTAIYEILLDGQRIEPQGRSEIEPNPSNATFPFKVSWYADVGTLTVGEHRASRALSWTEMISDGVNTFGPGGQIKDEFHNCVIIVVE